MAEIFVQLLGTPQIMADGTYVSFPYRKAEGLFYYLCVKKSISREEAVSIFWASVNDKTAKKNLRDALYHIRNLLGDDVLEITNNTMIRIGKGVSVDVDQLTLGNIQSRYTGDFLSYFFVKKCIEFENWVEETRSFYKNLYLRSIQNKLSRFPKEIGWHDIQQLSAALLESDLYNEENYRYLMQVYAQKGDYNTAIRHYQNLCKVLKADLNAEPDPATVQLYKFILKLKSLGGNSLQPEHYYLERANYIYELFTQVSAFQTNRGRSVLICGEIGTGKTTLINRVRELIDEPCVVLSHTFSRVEKDFYLQPWRDMMGQLMQLEQAGRISLLPAQHDMLQDLNLKLAVNQHDLSASPDKSRLDLMMEIIFNIFLYNTRHKKLIFVLDDIHWMDVWSKRLLGSIIFQLGGQNTIMLASCRIENSSEITDLVVPLLEKDLLTELKISNFTKEETTRVVADLLPDNTQAGDRLFEQTEGNPLFLLETIYQIQNHEKGMFPVRVVNAIRSLLMELDRVEAELLEILSLFNSGASTEELNICLQKSETELCTHLESLMKRCLIDETNHNAKAYYHFHSACIGRYVEEQMSHSKRRLQNRTIAQYYLRCFERTGDRIYYPKIIDHFLKSGDPHNAYLYQIHYYDDLASLYYEDYPRLDGVIPSGMAERNVKLDANTLYKLEKFLDEMKCEDTKHLKMLLLFTHGRQEIFEGNYREGLSYLQTSLELVQALDEPNSALRICSQAALCCGKIGNHEMIREYIEQYKQIAQQHIQLGEEGYAMYLWGIYHYSEGRYDEAIDALWKALDLHNKCKSGKSYFPIDVAATYEILGHCSYAKGEYDLAVRYYLQGVRVGRTGYLMNGLCGLYSGIGQSFYRLEDWDSAEEYLNKAMDLYRQTGVRQSMDKALVYQGMIAARKHNTVLADDLLQQAKQLAEQFYEPGIFKLLHEFEEMQKNIL